MTRVVATATGFYGGARRRAGDEFTIRDGEKLGSWMAPVKTPEAEHAVEAKKERAKPARQEPVALSEMNKARGPLE